jgi:hypothetical protein
MGRPVEVMRPDNNHLNYEHEGCGCSGNMTTLVDRLTHYADITTIEGKSYRLRENEQAAAARQNQPYVEP